MSSAARTRMPRLMYGTAWKKDRTPDLVHLALRAGFRAIDTANQPRHYREDLVGEGLRRAVADGTVSRDAVYLQTKFTPVDSQDPNSIPYDPSLPIAEQVRRSVAVSLKSLATPDAGSDASYIDCIVLHGPYDTDSEMDEAWAALWQLVSGGAVREVAISNATIDVVRRLVPPPVAVQNRFYAATGYDVDLRAYCRRAGITYQAFSVLTANPDLLRSAPVGRVARGAGVDPAAAIYALVQGLGGVAILDGTTSENHMAADLAGDEKTRAWIEGQGGGDWEECLGEFKRLIGDKEGT